MSSSEGSSEKEGKVLRKQPLASETTVSRPSIEDIPFHRPTINPDVEGILKGELVQLLESDRTKILTAEQEKILSRKDISVRQKERQLHDEIEAQKAAQQEALRKAEEDKVVLIQEEKNSIILERIAQRQEQRMLLKKEREERKAKEEMEAYVLRNNQQGWFDNEDLGEMSPRRLEEMMLEQQQQLQLQNQQQQKQRRRQQRKQNKGQQRKGQQSPYGGGQVSPYGGQVEPLTELPGEYADGVWSDAEDYGYSKQFPYPKKELIINEDTDVGGGSTSPEYPVENPYEDIEHLLVGTDDTGSSSSKSSSNRKSPISTGRLEGLEKGLTYIDKAAADLQVLLGRMAEYDTYSGRTPVNSAVNKKKKKGKKVTMTLEMDIQELDGGESEYDLFKNDVGTEVKALTLPGDVNPNMVDESTQVRSRDILLEYKAMLQAASRKALDEEIERKQLEELEAQAALEEYIFRLERKESLRRDAMTLTRPLGYKELDLHGASGDSASYDAQTQVSDKIMDEEYASKKGLVLLKDDILWPSCGSFDIEHTVKRIQDYIKQCWAIDPKWMFDIKPVQTISDDYRKRYVFEAKFSVPTKQHPVPQATASVFFIMEISHYAPKEDIIKVHYVVEGNRYIHTPGALPFQDRWLWSVITDKTRLQRAINF